MAFEAMTAEQYRALDYESLIARRDAIAAAYDDADVELSVVDADSKLFKAEIDRRNKQAELRSYKVSEVLGNKGNVIERTAKVVTDDAEGYYDSDAYKRNFMAFVQYRMAYEQVRTDAISVTGTYTSEQDYTSTYEHKVAVPQTMGREIVRKLDEYGHIYPKVRKLNLKGGVWFRIKDLELEAMWIDDKHVSPYQKDTDGDKISFSYFELECRFAQTLLASAVTWDDFQAMFVEAVAKAMVKAIEQAIVRGTGDGQPLGITVDPRLIGVLNTGAGATGYSQEPLATIVEVSAADIDDWKFWRSLPFKMPRLYREKGTWLMEDTLWGLHIDMLHDDENKPLGKYDPINDAEPYKIMGRGVELVEPAILPAFEDAEVGEVFAIYGDLSNYVLNTQPGMPMTTVQWVDHETNQNKIKSLVAMDGKVLDPYGFMLLVKKASA